MPTLTPDETLLGLLAATPRHGYQLLECFRDSAQLASVWNLSTSQLYKVLKRLEQEGAITGEYIASRDAPTRLDYRLTNSGQARLKAWLHEPSPSASTRAVRVEFLSRLYIARLLNIPTTAIVRAQKSVCQQERSRLAAERDQSSAGMEWLTREFVIGQLDAVLAWIDRCELVPHEPMEPDES